MDQTSESSGDRGVILFVDDSKSDFDAVVGHLQEAGYSCALVEDMNAGSVSCGVLPELATKLVEAKFDAKSLEGEAAKGVDVWDRSVIDLRRLKLAVVDILLPSDSEQTVPIVAAIDELRKHTGVDFPICVWSNLLEQQDTAAYLPRAREWGADHLIAKLRRR